MRRLLFTLIFLPFLTFAAWAQNCPPAGFKAYVNGVEVTEFCVGDIVNFRDCSCSGNFQGPDQYNIDPSNPNNFIVNTNNNYPFVFNTVGPVKVTQLYTQPCDPNSTPSRSQTFTVKPKPQPTFTTTQCGSDSVRITNTDTTYDTYSLNINGQNFPILKGETKAFPVNGSGSYTVTLTGTHAKANCGNFSSQTLTTATAPSTPVISRMDVLHTISSGQIEFTVNGLQSGFSYSLEQQNGSNFTKKSLINYSGNSSEKVTLSGLNTAVENCFRVRVFDACGSSQGIVSSTVCSLPLTAVAQNRKNIISWPSYSGGSASFSLTRREGSNSVTFPTLNSPFEDPDVSCGVNYCYELTITDGTGNLSLTNESCATAISTDTPLAPKLLTSFQPDNSLKGTVTLPPDAKLGQLQVLKGQQGGGFGNFTTATEPAFLDKTKNLKATLPCYQVTFTDNCGNKSEVSNTSCPVILTASHDRNKRTVDLEWTAYQGFAGTSVTYSLELLDEIFQPKSSRAVSGVFTFTDLSLSNTDQLLRYRIKAESDLGEVSYSNLETVAQELKIFVPNAFSPNNDGLNDVFEVKGRFQNNFSLVILNRWGQIIFESNDAKKGWDGKINGTEAPVGAYIYRIRAIDALGIPFQSTGTVNLVK